MSHAGKPSILLVDDMPLNLKILGQVLRKEYDIRFVTNGEDAIEVAASDHPPDLILLDVMMPGMDGYQVCRYLKDNRKTREIPIIFITVKNEEEDESQGLRLGAVDYITKPFVSAVVKRRIKTHLALHFHQQELEETVAQRTENLLNVNSRLQQEVTERKRIEKLLRHRERELEKKNQRLEETNTALNVVLEKIKAGREEQAEEVNFNLKKRILPHIAKLKKNRLDSDQEACLISLESNLNEIMRPYLSGLNGHLLNFSPMEIQVMDLVKNGYSTLEIAAHLMLSERTIESYRKTIRKKLGITNKKINLRTYLMDQS